MKLGPIRLQLGQGKGLLVYLGILSQNLAAILGYLRSWGRFWSFLVGLLYRFSDTRQVCGRNYKYTNLSQTNRNAINFRFLWKKTVGKRINNDLKIKIITKHCQLFWNNWLESLSMHSTLCKTWGHQKCTYRCTRQGVFQLENGQNCSHFTISQKRESHQRSHSNFVMPMMVLYRKWANVLGAKWPNWKTNLRVFLRSDWMKKLEFPRNFLIERYPKNTM